MSASDLHGIQDSGAETPVSDFGAPSQPTGGGVGREANGRGGDVRDGVEGERGIPSVNRIRSMQSRVTTLLAIGCMSVIGVGLLGWYYTQALTRNQRAQQSAQSTSKEHARAELTLPPLGHIDPPRVVSPSAPNSRAGSTDTSSTLAKLFGPAPELPAESSFASTASPPNAMGYPSNPAGYPPNSVPAANGFSSPSPKSAAQLALERRLGGPVFSTDTGRTPGSVIGSAVPVTGNSTSWSAPQSLGASAGSFPNVGAASGASEAAAPAGPVSLAAQSAGNIGPLLKASVTPAVLARVLPTQRFLLPKGAFLDCTLETAIDSTLPGMVTCVTATDSFGVDGTTVLIERGSKLVGETQGEVRQGAARMFVLWDEVRTPTGVVVSLSSPGTDELGRSGLPGEVNRHFFERFGAAMLVSVIEGTVQAATRPSNGGTVIYDPSASENIMTEILRSTVNIPPTITKHNGDRIQVLVARDLDFRSVYALSPIAAAR
jgi:type IV secretion system protein VirB10